MSNKYISQINNQNFVFPNFNLAEYDIDIIHNLNENSVTGTVTNFSATTVTSTGVTFTHDWTWVRNGADVVIANSGVINLLSVHVLAPGQDYYKPWRCVDLVTDVAPNNTAYFGSNTITITPSQLGLTSFTSGTFYLEFRFIGQKAIYPICQSYVANTLPTPTPVPTATPTPSPTPTPTPTGPTPTPTPTPATYTSGATINVTSIGWIQYREQGDSSNTYAYVASLGNYTITQCIICSSIQPGYPISPVANYTLITCGAPC
jgi:hypothetical protein